MRTPAKSQLKSLRAYIGKLDSGRRDIATRYKKVLQDEMLQAKHRELTTPRGHSPRS